MNTSNWYKVYGSLVLMQLLLFPTSESSQYDIAAHSLDHEHKVIITTDLCRKFGCKCDNYSVECTGIEPNMLNQHFFKLAPNIHSISLLNCSQNQVNLHDFSNFTSLHSISIQHCNVQQLIYTPSSSLKNLRVLNLSHNYLWNWNEICKTVNQYSSLERLDLSYNRITDLSRTNNCINKLHYLNLSFNKVSEIFIVPNAVALDLSSNILTRIAGKWPSVLEDLNLSNNPSLSYFPSLSLVPSLVNLNMDDCALTSLPLSISQNLRHFSLKDNRLVVIDFNSLNLPSLEELDLRSSLRLHSIVGILPDKVRKFHLTGSSLTYLPPSFFASAKKLRFLELLPNNWSCNNCLNKWLDILPYKMRPQIYCPNISHNNCSLGILKRVGQKEKYIVKARFAETAVLPCDKYGEPPLTVEWWLVRPEVFIGAYDVEKQMVRMNWTRNGSYRIVAGGPLMINNADKELVERYRCTVMNPLGNISQLVHFRLDYSIWFHLDMSGSVFWASFLAALITCGITFILNLLWIICRQIGLWWIKRIERNSRVREMVVAVERYRQRQMTMLSEAYHKKLEQIRDNYHQQVEQLRVSYTSQSERFRDYRAAQMENMNQHLESIRDNYNQQMCKLRDYGARRVEQLWEGYERQVNRLKMFSLQQRLGLMRKYKVKQQYLNKLAAKFADNSQTFTKPHPEVILTGSLRELDIEMHRQMGSFHSLPDYFLYDEDMLSNIQSELIHEFTDRKAFMFITDDIDDDAPCSSQQLQDGRKSYMLESLPFRHRYSLAEVENESTTLHISNENQPLSRNYDSSSSSD